MAKEKRKAICFFFVFFLLSVMGLSDIFFASCQRPKGQEEGIDIRREEEKP